MRIHRSLIIAALGLLVAGSAAWAQSTGATAAQGFNVQTLISKLALYLPEDAVQGMGGFGGQRAEGAGGAGSQTGQGAAGTAGTMQRAPFQFKRDTKLFLTKEQITKLLPILTSLRENPIPTPSKAKQVEASVDGILTAAQKAEYDQFQKEMQKFRESFRSQTGAGSASGTGQQAPDFQNMTDAQRQEFLNSLPEEARQRFQNGGQRGGAGAGGAQLTPLQQRQRQLDAFIKVLQDRQKQIST
jgi:hypothetical protein